MGRCIAFEMKKKTIKLPSQSTKVNINITSEKNIYTKFVEMNEKR